MDSVFLILFWILFIGWPLGMWWVLVYLRRHPRQDAGAGWTFLRRFCLFVGAAGLVAFGKSVVPYAITFVFLEHRPQIALSCLVGCFGALCAWQVFELGRRMRVDDSFPRSGWTWAWFFGGSALVGTALLLVHVTYGPQILEKVEAYERERAKAPVSEGKGASLSRSVMTKAWSDALVDTLVAKRERKAAGVAASSVSATERQRAAVEAGLRRMMAKEAMDVRAMGLAAPELGDIERVSGEIRVEVKLNYEVESSDALRLYAQCWQHFARGFIDDDQVRCSVQLLPCGALDGDPASWGLARSDGSWRPPVVSAVTKPLQRKKADGGQRVDLPILGEKMASGAGTVSVVPEAHAVVSTAQTSPSAQGVTGASQPPYGSLSEAQVNAVEEGVRHLLAEQEANTPAVGVRPTRLLSATCADGELLVFLLLGYEPERDDALEEYARGWQPIINSLVGKDWTSSTVVVACPDTAPSEVGLRGRLYPNGRWQFGGDFLSGEALMLAKMNAALAKYGAETSGDEEAVLAQSRGSTESEEAAGVLGQGVRMKVGVENLESEPTAPLSSTEQAVYDKVRRAKKLEIFALRQEAGMQQAEASKLRLRAEALGKRIKDLESQKRKMLRSLESWAREMEGSSKGARKWDALIGGREAKADRDIWDLQQERLDAEGSAAKMEMEAKTTEEQLEILEKGAHSAGMAAVYELRRAQEQQAQ